ncbi:MAG TPA: hypothetical protein PK961_06355, partial [bacterium]|nr:hypothetical protein [bacterium]
MKCFPAVWLSLICLTLMVVACSSADDDDDNDAGNDDDDDDDLRECDGEALTIAGLDPACAWTATATEIALTGGCFDADTTAKAIDSEGDETDLAVELIDNEHLIATLPGNEARGVYTITLYRDDLTAQVDFTSATDIVVSDSFNGQYSVVDLCDLDHPREALIVTPIGESNDIFHPTVNSAGERVYFVSITKGEADEYAIYGADLADGGNVEMLTDNQPPLYVAPSASPAGPTLAFQGCEDVTNVCSIYVVDEDGLNEKNLAPIDDILEIMGDQVGSWNNYEPVFSPDGSQVAYLREGFCDGYTSPEVACNHDFYSSVMVVSLDETCHGDVYSEPNAHFYANLQWTHDGYLVWQRRESDTSEQQIMMLKIDEDGEAQGEPFAVQPPAGNETWAEFWWLVYSPLETAMILQPFNTWDLVYYPLQVGTGDAAAAASPVPTC